MPSIFQFSAEMYLGLLKWGLMKDLFCPFREQKKRMEIGQSYIVHVHIDEDSYRIVASAKVERYFKERPPFYNLFKVLHHFLTILREKGKLMKALLADFRVAGGNLRTL